MEVATAPMGGINGTSTSTANLLLSWTRVGHVVPNIAAPMPQAAITNNAVGGAHTALALALVLAFTNRALSAGVLALVNAVAKTTDNPERQTQHICTASTSASCDGRGEAEEGGQLIFPIVIVSNSANV